MSSATWGVKHKVLLHRLSTQQSKAVVDPFHAHGFLDTDKGRYEHCVHSSQAMPAVRRLLCLSCLLSNSCFACHACWPTAALPTMPAVQQLLCLSCLLSSSCFACHACCPPAALPVTPAAQQLLCLFYCEGKLKQLTSWFLLLRCTLNGSDD